MIMATAITLRAYADESGIHDGAERCVIPGYFASPHKWLRFSKEWGRCLNEAWPTFHAKDFFGRAGRPLSRQAADLFLSDLLRVIERHDIYPFAGEVILTDWVALSYGERKYLTGAQLNNRGKLHGGAPNRPYYPCFVNALIKVARTVRPGKIVEFVFDRQKHFAPLALELYGLAEGTLPLGVRAKLRGCSFFGKEGLPPLQVADLLAHCLYKRDGDVNARRVRAGRVCAKGGFEFEIYDTRSFEMILGGIPVEERELLRSIKSPLRPGQR